MAKDRNGEKKRYSDRQVKKLDGAFQALAERLNLDQKLEIHEALKVWPDVVGEKLASHVVPLQVQKQTLFVKADGAVWMNEFNFVKANAIRRLNEELGRPLIRDIRFKN